MNAFSKYITKKGMSKAQFVARIRIPTWGECGPQFKSPPVRYNKHGLFWQVVGAICAF